MSVIRPEDEVVRICQELIRIDSSNFGDGSGPGERAAAEYTAALISDVGLDVEIFESAPGRANVVTRMAGEDPSADALVVHGHLDVVPAMKEQWTVDPFSGELKDGLIWGRGAVDMKDMDAMILSVLRDFARTGRKPKRDIIFAFFADEEAGGTYGARYAVEHRRELFDGATEAISEVGGFSATIGGQRTYLLQTAEKGLSWLRLVAHGRAGHGSQINTDNAVTRLAAAVTRIGEYQWPIELTPTTKQFLDGVTELTGVEFDPDNPDILLKELGTVARFVGATLQNTSNPTLLRSGYKHNVIPESAEAFTDCRTLPGQQEKVFDIIRELAGDGIEISYDNKDISLEVPFAGNLVDSMIDALHSEDPGAKVLPYTLSGGTDNKSLSKIGITGYGFAPLMLPDELDFTGMFHGVDERVPADSLKFGARVLNRLLTNY
ncbi:M20/M25/M40 family metallo-hydrolase [Paenarthrobacter ureafaciens]|uniref:M20/M25/M40 family metallo-hydrolase n=1 Tax=Paenarthrobacter ureafaciens TaxID=37931 RepID=UPI0009AEAC4B|nr:M20/M25/M40 family metallo-hydrolase [Paenarthrobacter ureafaciens]GLU60344.1 peptidase M20 [Paenarthrobacter ureafaciens]GLU64584.1 peptidase M20 [Paenarthrobacter ureafaciens]GLU68863.1 peptidase M20 [Paenarthrobacter ureafaciens]GLU73151.1 peptidase M20 [Paenarthrobacter ureafaciens]GLU77387.1 peptidase M20 [Paenarthrobacter ureafaciens]